MNLLTPPVKMNPVIITYSMNGSSEHAATLRVLKEQNVIYISPHDGEKSWSIKIESIHETIDAAIDQIEIKLESGEIYLIRFPTRNTKNAFTQAIDNVSSDSENSTDSGNLSND